MSAATNTKFWKSMAERFGKRWFDVHGPKPTETWVDLLDGFEWDAVEDALLRLKDRPERDRAHPPTHAEFQLLLAAAARSRGGNSDAQVRQHWRSIVVATCLRNAALLNLVPWGETRLDKLHESVHRIAIGVCNELTTWACEEEARHNDRTPAMEQHINSTLWNLLKPWARQGEFDISHLSAPNNAPRGTSNNEVST